MNDGFYRAFEERYRGSRELIKGRLATYLPFVEPLLKAYPTAAAIDLGCGRGEWLEILAGSGFKPMGIDLDKGMLEACLERGLPVEQGDALAYLSALSDDSQALVSAFHVVEHITFDQLGTLVAEALRVLKPGGLLIMETPNPENIVVATRNFYLDPTHQRPIPTTLLAFVAEFAGFPRVKTLRLQEPKDLVNRADVSLQDVFSGASPDYAVVAQKHAPNDVMALTDYPFSLEYGLSLENLLTRWDSRFDRLETKAQQAETKAQQAETKAQQAETKAQQAEAASNERFAELQAVYASTSWRLTRPIRAFKQILGGDFSILGRSTAAVTLKAKQVLRAAIANGIGHVLNQPKLRSVLIPVFKTFPWLFPRLFRVMHNTGVVLGQEAYATFASFSFAHLDAALMPQTMTPRARRIYVTLKAAVDKKNRGNR